MFAKRTGVIDNYDLAYFERKGCVQRDLDLNCVW